MLSCAPEGQCLCFMPLWFPIRHIEEVPMPVTLDTPAEDFDTDSTQFDTMLGNLQANILKPHGRDFARHVFIRFTASPAAVKTWIHTAVAPLVTTALKQFRTPPHTDGGVVVGFFLSSKGYQHLGL